jgi:DNA primase
VLELAGREVRIASPNKALFDERNQTKLDLVRYYAAAEPLMRTMGGRPVPMQRVPREVPLCTIKQDPPPRPFPLAR